MNFKYDIQWEQQQKTDSDIKFLRKAISKANVLSQSNFYRIEQYVRHSKDEFEVAESHYACVRTAIQCANFAVCLPPPV